METLAPSVPRSKTTPRLLHIEFLRILAIFCVIYNHTNERGFFCFAAEGNTFLRWLYLMFSIFCKIAVPLFFAISGATLLGKTEPIRQLLRKRVLRMAVVLVAVSLFYGVLFAYFHGDLQTPYDYFEKIYDSGMLVPLWYLYSYIAFLLMLPLLRRMAQAMRETEFLYLAAVSLLLTGVIPMAEELLFKGACTLNSDLRGALFVTGNMVYPLLGYYMEHVMPKERISRKRITAGIVLSGLSLLASAYLTFFQAKHTGVLSEGESQAFFSSFIMIPACTVYIGAKMLFENARIPEWVRKLLLVGGSTAFGVYLLDEALRWGTAFVYETLSLYMPSPLASICWALCAMLSGMVLVYILKKLPVLRKLL